MNETLILLVIVIGLAAVLARQWLISQKLEAQLIQGESERRELQDRLKLETQMRSGLVEALPDGVLLVDREKRILLANPVAEQFFGHQLKGQTIIAATRNDDLDSMLTELEHAPHEIFERRVPCAGRTLRAIAQCFSTDQGSVNLFILHDETELIRLGRARREMVANISHELRHPITTIGLIAETLQDGVIKNKRARKMVKDIQREAAHLGQLVQEMRDLSLIESGQMPVKLTPTNIPDLIQDCLNPLSSLAEDKQQTITINIEPDLVALADARQIERVLRNIIHNAIKFTPKGGEIWVSASATSEDEVTVSVRDSGPGIAKEALSRIFERFYQENPARGDGTGLGLAIARHIILAHGGRIWAESQAGQGAIFYFSLSLANTPQHQESPTPSLN